VSEKEDVVKANVKFDLQQQLKEPRPVKEPEEPPLKEEQLKDPPPKEGPEAPPQAPQQLPQHAQKRVKDVQTAQNVVKQETKN